MSEILDRYGELVRYALEHGSALGSHKEFGALYRALLARLESQETYLNEKIALANDLLGKNRRLTEANLAQRAEIVNIKRMLLEVIAENGKLTGLLRVVYGVLHDEVAQPSPRPSAILNLTLQDIREVLIDCGLLQPGQNPAGESEEKPA